MSGSPANNQKLQEYSQKAVFYSSLTNPSTRFVNNVIYALVAFAGAFLILAGKSDGGRAVGAAILCQSVYEAL